MGCEMWDFLPEARKEFGSNLRGHSNYLAYGPDGEVVNEYYEGACYADLFYGDEEIYKLFIGFGKELVHLPRDLQWANWVINESMFANAFITKDAQEGYELGFEIDTSVDYTLTNGGMTVLRTMHEWDDGFWCKYVEMGFSGVEALALYHTVYPQELWLDLRNHTDNHMAFPNNCPFSCYEGKDMTEMGVCYQGGDDMRGSSIGKHLTGYKTVDLNLDKLDLETEGVGKDVFTGKPITHYKFNKDNLTKVLNKLKGQK